MKRQLKKSVTKRIKESIVTVCRAAVSLVVVS